MSKKDNKVIGMIGELAVVNYLEKLGFEVIEKNYRIPSGEIDIIFIEEDTIVFGEVKTRRSCYYGKPSISVDNKKREKIINTAKYYMRSSAFTDLNIRFDVFEVYFNSRKIVHIKNAYWEEVF